MGGISSLLLVANPIVLNLFGYLPFSPFILCSKILQRLICASCLHFLNSHLLCNPFHSGFHLYKSFKKLPLRSTMIDLSSQIWSCPCHPVGIASHPCPAEPQRLAGSGRQRKMQHCRPRRPVCQTPLAARRAQKRRRRRRRKLKPPKPVRVLRAGGVPIVGACGGSAQGPAPPGNKLLGIVLFQGRISSSFSFSEPWEDQDLLEGKLEVPHMSISPFIRAFPLCQMLCP